MSAGWWKIGLVILAAVVALSVGETFLARGMRQVHLPVSGWKLYLRAAVGNGWVLSGIALMALHLGLYAIALGEADLSLVMPLTAASYPLGTLLARFVLNEEVNLTRWLGTLAITAGVGLIAWGERSSPP